MRMKLAMAGLVVALTVVSAVPASAAQGNNSVDGSLVLATGRGSGFDTGIGLGAGVTIGMPNRLKSSDVSMAIRGDMTYFNWDGSIFGIGYSYSSLIFFGGPRLYIGRGGKGTAMPFVDGGLELAFDSAEVPTPFGKASRSDLHLGLAGGGGIEIPLSDQLKFTVSGRLHLITDDFLSLAATLGASF